MRVEKLQALAMHPNTPKFERAAALAVLKKQLDKQRAVKRYEWIDFSKREGTKVDIKT